MRTTLDLPEPLLKEAMSLAHAKTKTAVIVTALENLIRKRKLEGLKSYKGRVDLSMDLDALRGRP